ncbi:MAG: phosphomannose isomerase type II C-terminal cupin domain [bacterium]|nr:phosphomannose isomerase type II C-terminal cupin domain [bacterium]
MYTACMEGLAHYEKEIRPWGNFERFTLNEKSTVKIITVNPREEFSLQSHKHRGEFWRVLSGTGVITLDQDHHTIGAGESFFSPVGHEHRMAGGPEGLTFLEISFGDFDENDIKRLEDRYGRT